ncbi:Cell wall hydrolase/autolysin [Citrifermentans bremense]|uniref:Cell wall hydrolase/autolysin n=1 Tax=Citrifermentans bremense TaxID=60035 RepID=A0A6S6M940_9BACT|nr:N-acetylmuramoyl-L-alanine amidase [Citrifermentans bremense]BCG47975.1 Cell wall hydrolase/autolysin [Citrifermentans bremense]
MYKVKFYRGDYIERQRQANSDNCVAYVEQHFNSYTGTDDYSVVVTGSNASPTSKNWGRWYAAAVAREFNSHVGGDNGIKVGGYDGRGDGNLRYTKMPAILLEPLFASNPHQAELIRSESGQERLARILCESIQRFFQDGGTIGFSVGHKYKTSNPSDRGVPLVGGGLEADFAEKVLIKAKEMLEAIDAPVEERQLRVMKGGELLWSGTVDADSDVRWDPVRGVLQIEA